MFSLLGCLKEMQLVMFYCFSFLNVFFECESCILPSVTTCADLYSLAFFDGHGRNPRREIANFDCSQIAFLCFCILKNHFLLPSLGQKGIEGLTLINHFQQISCTDISFQSRQVGGGQVQLKRKSIANNNKKYKTKKIFSALFEGISISLIFYIKWCFFSLFDFLLSFSCGCHPL